MKSRLHDISLAIQAFKVIPPARQSDDDDRSRAYSKTQRAQERLRRAVSRYLGGSNLPTDKAKATKGILTEIVASLERSLSEV